MKRIITIKELVFESEIRVFIGHEYKKVVLHYQKHVEEVDDEEFNFESNSDAKSIRGNHKIVYIWLDDFWESAHWISVLNHEIMHVTYHIMNYSGIQLGNDTEEPYAYYSGFLMREILHRIIEKPVKKKKK